VRCNGQTISLAGSPSDTQLIVVGASSQRGSSGTGAIQYTDGTVQGYQLTLDDWLYPPSDSSNTTIAATTYINRSAEAGNGVAGQLTRVADVFAVSIPLEPGKTVASVTLPTVSTSPGTYPMHVFALGLG
jgi:hypothetical protein